MGTDACREVSVCIGSIGCAGLLPPDADPNDFRSDTLEASCAGGTSCATGTCESRMLCMPPDGGGSGGDDGGCSVAKLGAKTDSAPLAALLGLVALAGINRRRRR